MATCELAGSVTLKRSCLDQDTPRLHEAWDVPSMKRGTTPQSASADESVEPPERVVYRQDLDAGPSGLTGDAAESAGTHHCADRLGVGLDPALRETPQHTCSGEECFRRVARVERLANASSMTITVLPSARAALAWAMASIGWAMSWTHSKNKIRS